MPVNTAMLPDASVPAAQGFVAAANNNRANHNANRRRTRA